MIYGNPYYYVNGCSFLKGSKELGIQKDGKYVINDETTGKLVYIHLPIDMPLGTIWEGKDVYGDFFEKNTQFTIEYYKELKNMVFLRIIMNKSIVNTCWKVHVHDYFSERYNLLVKHIPMKNELKIQIIIHYYVKNLCNKYNLCEDIENLIFVFLDYKSYLKRIL